MANIPTVGLRNVGSYQISGHPYITGAVVAAGTETKVSFPYITKKFTFILSGSTADLDDNESLRLHFVSTGSGTDVIAGKHYIPFDTHEDTLDFDVKCKEVWVSAPGDASAFFIYASLTNIPTGSMYAITGSGISDPSSTAA